MKRMDHILIIEDAPNFRQYLAALLKREFPQARVAATATVKAAFAELAKQSPDLVVLDLALPTDEDDTSPRAESGLALLKQLKSLTACPKVIVMTSHSEMEAECRALGADGFVSKSMQAKQLGTQLLAVMGRSLAESVA